MPVQIRDSSAVHLLQSVPLQVGYRPRESLVLVPVMGRTTHGVLRIDLPSPGHFDRCATIAVGHLRRMPDIDDVIVIVYTDAPALDGPGVAYDALVTAVIDRAEAIDIRVTGEICVGSDGWSSYRDPQLRSLDEIDCGEDMPADGPREGADVPRSDAADRATVARFVTALDAMPGDALTRLRPGAHPAAHDADLDCELDAFAADPHGMFAEALTATGKVSPARAALWLWILTCPAIRDVVLTQWVSDAAEGRRTLAWQESWLDGVSDQPDFPVRLAGDGSRPDAERVRGAREFVRGLAGRAPNRHLSACLAVCGWLSWALGSSSLAAEFAGRAIELAPHASFPALILQMANAGILPGWAFDEAGLPLTPPWVLADV